jgi:magnesium-transporting ATPase (P-type)
VHDRNTVLASPPATGRAWHALDPDIVVDELGTGPAGLDETAVAERLERYGPNELEAEEPKGNLEILLHQFKSPLIYILLVAAVVTVAIGEYVDTGVIAAVLVLNATVGFIQERKADRSVRALMQLAAPKSVVVRAGRRQEVDSTGLVPGDFVLLESGTRVPADLRVVSATALRVDESLLTGESTPVTKTTAAVAEDALASERSCMAHMGSVVASGRGRGVVVGTGLATELGKISAQIRGEEQPESPLTRRMFRFANLIAVAVAVSAVLTFLLGLVLGEPASEMFLTAVALAVAIVPEGLPVALTVAMALGVRRMAQRNAIIRNLPAVETLGSTNTIGSDKTGTLTRNRMTVQRLWAGGHVYTLRDDDTHDGARLLTGLPDVDDPLHLIVHAGVLTNEADLHGWDGDVPETTGDPTEAALLVVAARLGVDPDEARERHPSVAEVPFEPDLRYSLAVREHGGGQRMWVKGAPERVLELATAMLDEGGAVAELDRDAVHAAAEAMAERGLRVLAMAYRDLEEPHAGGDALTPGELVFAGLQGMLDPPREGVRDAIAGCNAAGLRVLMITGDHAATARAIAEDLGLIEDADAPVLTGHEVERMSEAELARHVLDVQVYARVSPDHKYRIVKALRSHGEVTAVTGDGVNDGPALRAAEIGIAMGKSGTDVAREASDMVLADDNFVSIYHAVEEGRVVFDNVRKVTYFLVSTGVAAIVAILYSLGAGLPLPFLPAQLLWLNVVTNGLQDVALAFEPGEKGVLDRPPRRRDEPIVSRLLWERTLFTGLTMAIGSLVMFTWALGMDKTIEQARTVALTTMVLYMAFHVYNARSERRSIIAISPLRNPFLLGATLFALTIHALALYWGPTQFILRVEPVEAQTWLRMVAIASAVILVSEAHKLLRRETFERPQRTRGGVGAAS